MEIKRKQGGSTNETAAVKAAAWAWFEHGSRSEGKLLRESDATRSSFNCKPSRYKLEAMRMPKDHAQEHQKHSENSLLDAYEVECISRRLDSLIDCASLNNTDKIHSQNVVSSGEDSNNGRMKKKKKKPRGYFGFGLSPSVVCGSREDVVEPRGFRDRPGRRLHQPEKHVLLPELLPAGHGSSKLRDHHHQHDQVPLL